MVLNIHCLKINSIFSVIGLPSDVPGVPHSRDLVLRSLGNKPLMYPSQTVHNGLTTWKSGRGSRSNSQIGFQSTIPWFIV